MVRELHKVKEEIIDGEWRAHPGVLEIAQSCCCPGLPSAGARMARQACGSVLGWRPSPSGQPTSPSSLSS